MNFIVSLLMYLFPVKTVGKLVVTLLEGLAVQTSNKVDDKLVAIIKDALVDKSNE